jgi:colicin import membrane protein
MRLPRFARLSALSLAFLFNGFALGADAPEADPAAEMARAATMRDEASALRSTAEARFSDEEIACYARFLVNRCLDKARERRVVEIRKARQLDLEAGRIELADKNRRFAERQAEQAEVAPQKAIERSEQEARNRADSETRLRNLSEKDADRVKREQDAKSRGLIEAEERHRFEAAEAQRRADEASAAAQRAEQARSDREDYEERARKAAEKKVEKDRKAAVIKP